MHEGCLLLRAHVVDLQDHLDELRGEHDLLLLGVQRLDDVMFLHVRVSAHHAVDAERRRVLLNVTRLQLRERLDGQQSAVLGEC